jgi:hypothetical protein
MVSGSARCLERTSADTRCLKLNSRDCVIDGPGEAACFLAKRLDDCKPVPDLRHPSAASRTRLHERQDAREHVAEFSPAPRIDEPSGSLHRVPQGFRRPNQVLRRDRFDIKHGAHLGDDLTARVGWQIS